jgi:hypothetical protein
VGADGPKHSIDPALFEGGQTDKTEQGSPEASERARVRGRAPNQPKAATEQRSPGRSQQMAAIRIRSSEEGKRQVARWEDNVKKEKMARWDAWLKGNAEAAKAKREASKAEREAEKEAGREKPRPAKASEPPVTKADPEIRKAEALATKAEHEARITEALATRAEHEARIAGAAADEAEGLAKLGGKRWRLHILLANAATGIGVVIAGVITKDTEALLFGATIISGASASAMWGLSQPSSSDNQGRSP